MASTGKRIAFLCSTCGSKLVTRDAWAEWDEDDQQWALGAVYDYAFCHDCQEETQLTERLLGGK